MPRYSSAPRAARHNKGKTNQVSYRTNFRDHHLAFSRKTMFQELLNPMYSTLTSDTSILLLPTPWKLYPTKKWNCTNILKAVVWECECGYCFSTRVLLSLFQRDSHCLEFITNSTCQEQLNVLTDLSLKGESDLRISDLTPNHIFIHITFAQPRMCGNLVAQSFSYKVGIQVVHSSYKFKMVATFFFF